MKKHPLRSCVILTVIFALAILALGIMNYANTGIASTNEVLELKMNYITADLQDYVGSRTDYTADELYNYIKTLYAKDEYIKNGETVVSVFERGTGRWIGATEVVFVGALLDYFDFQQVFWNGSYYYVSDFGSDEIIVLQIPLKGISGTGTIMLIVILAITVVSAIVFFLFLLIAFRKKMGKSSLVKAIKTMGLVWIILSTLVCLLFNYFIMVYRDIGEINDIITETGNNVEIVLAMSDEEVQTRYQEMSEADSLAADYVNSKNCGNEREKLLYCMNYYLINPVTNKNSFCYDVTFKDTIWNTDIPIIKRLRYTYNEKYAVNAFFSPLLQTAMFIILYIFLSGLIRDPDKSKNYVVENASTKPLKKIVFLKNIADSLVAVVGMAMLREAINDNFSAEWSQFAVKLTLSLAGTVSLLATVVVPYMIVKADRMKRLFVLDIALCIVGGFLALSGRFTWLYPVGYVILSFSGSLFINLWIVHPLRVESSTVDGFRQVGIISDAGSIGSLFGVVAAGVLNSFFPNKVVFFIAFFLMIICLFLFIRFPNEEYKGFQPQTGYVRKTVFKKSIIPGMLMLVVPFGFIGYFFSAVIPLNVAGAGLSTTVVSFIYFVRQAGIYNFKNSKKLRKVWRKWDTVPTLCVGLIAAAAVLFGYYFFKNIYITFLLTIALAFLMSGLSSRVRAFIYDLTGGEDKAFFGNSLLYLVGTKAGKSAAPSLTAVGLYPLSVIMALFSSVYLLIDRVKKKRTKSE